MLFVTLQPCVSVPNIVCEGYMIPDDPSIAFARVRARWVILSSIAGFVGPLVVGALVRPQALDTEGPRAASAILGCVSYALIAVALWGVLRRTGVGGPVLGVMPRRSEVWRYPALAVPMAGLAFAGAYLLFLPLSYVAPGLVTWWLLAIPPTFLWCSGLDAALGNAAIMLTLVVLAPVVEELVFRGFLLNRWVAKYGTRVGIGLSAGCFALLHIEILGAVVFAVILSLVYLRTRSLVGPILVHMSNNALVGVLALADGFLSGGEPPLTLSEFQSTWWLGVLGGVIGVPWLLWYYVTHLKAKPTMPEGAAPLVEQVRGGEPQ